MDYTFNTSALSPPWWEQITDEEWAEMSPRELLLTKAIIPQICLFSEHDENAIFVEVDPPVELRSSGDSMSLTVTVTLK